MPCAQCQGIEQHFDTKVAEGDLKRYRKKGPDKTTQLLIEGLVQSGLEHSSLLDIGGGIGVLQMELLKRGVRHAQNVDASPAYLQVAKRAAADGEMLDEITQIEGDFVEMAPDIPAADIVTLDRVICCYHDWVQLVRLSTARAKSVYAIAYPRDRWWVKAVIWVENLIFRLKGSPFRVYVHPVSQIQGMIKESGFQLISSSQRLVWRVEVYIRQRSELEMAA